MVQRLVLRRELAQDGITWRKENSLLGHFYRRHLSSTYLLLSLLAKFTRSATMAVSYF